MYTFSRHANTGATGRQTSSVDSHQNNLGLGCYRYRLVQHCPLVVSALQGTSAQPVSFMCLLLPVSFSFKCFLKSPHVYLNNDRQDNILFFKLNGAPLWWYTPVKPPVKGLSQKVVMSSLPEIYGKLKNGLAIPRIPVSK